ncbi:cupin domain-containing protein [Streptomyces sp. NPDC091217]|uniref:cupin domain-containing protein n=1 Tax=Streptomyces sp. NPDC091217 TaxID=3365975 RepID=UPI0038200B78
MDNSRENTQGDVVEPAASPSSHDATDRIDPGQPSTLVFDPTEYQEYDAGQASLSLVYLGRVGIVTWNLEPGQWNPSHMHPDTDHVHIVLRGELEYHLADLSPMRVSAGQAVIVPAGIAHGIRNASAGRACYMAVANGDGYSKVTVDQPA